MNDDRNFNAAIRNHEMWTKSGIEGFKVVIDTGMSILRLLSTVNAGGLIALLAFIGTIAGKQNAVFQSVSVFIYPMTLFGLGLIFSVAATGGMYFAQFFYGTAPKHMLYNYDHPYSHQTFASKRYKFIGVCWHTATVILAFTSFVFFIAGIYQCRGLIMSARL